MRIIIFCLVMLISTSVYADRVCLEKSTGKLVEYQSGNAPLGTLTQNAVNSGYDANDVEEKYVSKAEWQQIEYVWIIKPAEEKLKEKEKVRKQKEKKIKQKLGLSESDWNDLVEALK